MKLLLAFLMLSISSVSFAVPETFDEIFIEMGKKYQVDPVILKSIAYHESRLKPFATNINGEGFHFSSLNKAISGLRYVSQKPWMLKIREKNGNKIQTGRRFYTSEFAMKSALSTYLKDRKSKGKKTLTTLHSMKTKGQDEYIMTRKLNVDSTDIGLTQINYKYHDNESTTVIEWYNPRINIEYQAKFYSQLVKKHKDPMIAVAHYHSGTRHLQNIYMSYFKGHYKKVSASWKHS